MAHGTALQTTVMPGEVCLDGCNDIRKGSPRPPPLFLLPPSFCPSFFPTPLPTPLGKFSDICPFCIWQPEGPRQAWGLGVSWTRVDKAPPVLFWVAKTLAAPRRSDHQFWFHSASVPAQLSEMLLLLVWWVKNSSCLIAFCSLVTALPS